MIKGIKFQKIFWFIIILLEIFILIIAGWSYKRKEPVNLNFTQDDLIYDSGENGAYLDTTSSSAYVASKEFLLPKGLYTVSINYEYSDPVLFSLTYIDGRYDSNASGDIPARITDNSTCDFRVSYSNRPMQVRGRLRGDAGEGSYILVKNISITDSPVALRNFVFELFLVLAFLNVILFLAVYRHKIRIDQENSRIFRALLVLTFIVSIPLMVDYLPSGHDLPFHLMRIEGLKAGLLSKVFPVKIQPDWLNGHGYAVSVFYGDVFLYFPALLRIFGISVQSVYKLYVLLVNIATIFISYYCFSKMSSKKCGLICAALYSLNIYRLVCLYTRAAVGEFTAMVFFPLVLYGLWKVYTLPGENKEHKQSWITIAAGYTGILVSHMISCEIIAIFTVLTCLLLWKSTFSKKNFWILVKAVMVIILLNLWFIVPVLDYLSSSVYVINNPNEYTPFRLDERAAYPAQLFMNTYGVTEQSKSYSAGTQNEMPMTLGISFLLLFAAWFIGGTTRKTNKSSNRMEMWLCVFLGMVSLLFVTYLLPYTALANLIPFLEFPERSLQYPWRFLSVAALFFTWLACLFFSDNELDIKKRYAIAAIIVVVAVWQGISFMSQILNQESPNRIYQEGNLTTCEVSGGEYLLLNSNKEDYINDVTYDVTKMEVKLWNRQYNKLELNITNLTQEEQQIEIPLLYYKGYKAEIKGGGYLGIKAGTSGRIRLDIPEDFKDTVTVGFEEPWYWRICELISLLSFIIIVINFFKRNIILSSMGKIRKVENSKQ